MVYSPTTTPAVPPQTVGRRFWLCPHNQIRSRDSFLRAGDFLTFVLTHFTHSHSLSSYRSQSQILSELVPYFYGAHFLPRFSSSESDLGGFYPTIARMIQSVMNLVKVSRGYALVFEASELLSWDTLASVLSIPVSV